MTDKALELSLLQEWKENPCPEVGKPSGRTVFEDNGVSRYLWHTDNTDEWIHSDTSMKIRE